MGLRAENRRKAVPGGLSITFLVRFRVCVETKYDFICVYCVCVVPECCLILCIVIWIIDYLDACFFLYGWSVYFSKDGGVAVGSVGRSEIPTLEFLNIIGGKVTGEK
jgi:hypothetical protein